MALEAAGLEHSAGAQLVLRVLEDAAEGALVRRLRCLSQRLELRDRGLDRSLGSVRQPELGARDHLAMVQARPAVAQAELDWRQPAPTVRIDDQRPLQDRGPVTAVGARIHPDPATDRPRYG